MLTLYFLFKSQFNASRYTQNLDIFSRKLSLCALKYEPYNNLKSSKPEAHCSSVLLRKIIIIKRVIWAFIKNAERQNNNSNTYKNMQQKVGPKNYPKLTTWNVIANTTWKPWRVEGVEAGKFMQKTPLEWRQKLDCSG